MQYPAIVVANYLIKLANRDKVLITPMKLQKILYLANGISHKRLGEKLIRESFEAWTYGPVIPNIYKLYRNFKSNNITSIIDDDVYVDDYNFISSSSFPINEEHLSIIEEAWNSAKSLSAIELSAWSHNKNSPWDKAYNAQPKQKEISDSEIKAYFLKFIPN